MANQHKNQFASLADGRPPLVFNIRGLPQLATTLPFGHKSERNKELLKALKRFRSSSVVVGDKEKAKEVRIRSIFECPEGMNLEGWLERRCDSHSEFLLFSTKTGIFLVYLAGKDDFHYGTVRISKNKLEDAILKGKWENEWAINRLDGYQDPHDEERWI